MKLTKAHFDKDLQKLYYPLLLLSYLIAKNWGVTRLKPFFNLAKGKGIRGYRSEQICIPSKNGGPDIRLRIFRPNSKEVLPAMLYIHGGGYILGYPETSLKVMESYLEKRPCVIVAPDYRKAMKDPYPAALNDCYDTLLWMKENAKAWGMREDSFVVAGHSAGGGLTAAVTLKACDTGEVKIAFQMPIYPMIDHRQHLQSAKEMDIGVPVWNATNNAFAWKKYLAKVEAPIPTYASAALAKRYDHLPPTITFVGELEPFRDETLAYVKALKESGVPVKFELFEKAYHAFESLVPDAEISKKANDFQFNAWAEFYDTYFKN